MENKKNTKFIVIAIVAALVFAGGITYAYFAASVSNTASKTVTAKTSDRDVFTTSGEAVLSMDITNDVMQQSEGKNDYSVYESDEGTFTVSLTAGSGTATCTYDIALSDEGDQYAKSEDAGSLLEYTIKGSDGTQSFAEKNIDTALSTNNGVLGSFTISDSYEETGEQVTTTQTWTVESRFYNLAENQSAQLNQEFEHHVKVVNVNCTNTNGTSPIPSEEDIQGGGIQSGTLAAMMRDNADTDTIIDFNVQSAYSGTSGIYMSTNTDSGEPVYYYRGRVDNNLKFAGFCWKIIRTTETGGTKIIYNGTPNASGGCTADGDSIGDSAYNTTKTDNTYVGYMVGSSGASTYATTHSNVSDSTIKTTVDNWYEENIQNKGLTVYLEDTVYCNDRNLVDGTTNNNLGTSYGILGYGTNPTGYGTLARSSYYTLSANPSLVCKNTTGYVPEDNDAFTVSSIIGNGKLKYPVGLITTDELIYAGMNTTGAKTTFFDYQDNNFLAHGYYWTMSPVCMDSDGNANVTTVNSAWHGGSWTYYLSGVRPVISLRPETQVVSGFGTQGDPYVVE